MDEATKEIVGEIEQEGASEQLEDNTEEVTMLYKRVKRLILLKCLVNTKIGN